MIYQQNAYYDLKWILNKGTLITVHTFNEEQNFATNKCKVCKFFQKVLNGF